MRDFARQGVDLVRVESGAFPGPRELLADVQDANVGVYDGRAGDSLTVLGAGGRARGVHGQRSRAQPPGGRAGAGRERDRPLRDRRPRSRQLSGEAGYGELALRLDDPSPDAAAGDGRSGAPLPRARCPGSPASRTCRRCVRRATGRAKADTEQFAQLLGVITVLALLSALVLISNTMSTLVAEQTREIGIMRAVGARRRQVALVYLRTTLLLGALGALVGIGLGIVLSSLLARYFGSAFWAIDVGFGVDPVVLLVSLLVGLAGPAARGAAGDPPRPARRSARGARGERLGARRSGRRRPGAAACRLPAAGDADRTAQHRAAQAAQPRHGVDRGAGGREPARGPRPGRGRDRGSAHSPGATTSRTCRSRPAGERSSTSGPSATIRVDAGSQPRPSPCSRTPSSSPAGRRSCGASSVTRSSGIALADGRWFSAGEEQAGERVAVIERNIAQLVGVEVGDRVTLATAAGDADFRIVGIAKNQQEDGTALYVPLDDRARAARPARRRERLLDQDRDRPTRRSSTAPRACSRTGWRRSGYEVTSEIKYVAERDEIAANSSLTTTIAVLGFVIVAMSMVGLANAITTNVLERTREIGILRCIGARARDIRRIFTTEGVALALAGWLLGIPLGYALTRLLVWLVWEVVDVRLSRRLPACEHPHRARRDGRAGTPRALPPRAPRRPLPARRRAPLRLRSSSPTQLRVQAPGPPSGVPSRPPLRSRGPKALRAAHCQGPSTLGFGRGSRQSREEEVPR